MSKAEALAAFERKQNAAGNTKSAKNMFRRCVLMRTSIPQEEQPICYSKPAPLRPRISRL